jgi:hypothetical protein
MGKGWEVGMGRRAWPSDRSWLETMRSSSLRFGNQNATRIHEPNKNHKKSMMQLQFITSKSPFRYDETAIFLQMWDGKRSAGMFFTEAVQLVWSFDLLLDIETCWRSKMSSCRMLPFHVPFVVI